MPVGLPPKSRHPKPEIQKRPSKIIRINNIRNVYTIIKLSPG